MKLVIKTPDGNVDVPLSGECNDQMDVKDGGVAHVRLVRVGVEDPPEREVLEARRKQRRIDKTENRHDR